MAEQDGKKRKTTKPAKGNEDEITLAAPEQAKKKRAAKAKRREEDDLDGLDDEYAEQEAEEDAEDFAPRSVVPSKAKITAISAAGDFTEMELKPDHQVRPIWVCPDGHIFLETFSPVYKQAYDFLIAIAEPVCRPALMHEYQLTSYSLYAAASIGLKTEDIISVLNRLSKVKLPKAIETMIRDSTQSYGKVKLVLQRNRYWIESAYPDILTKLSKNEDVRAAVRVSDDVVRDPRTGFVIAQTPQAIAIPGGGAVAMEQGKLPRLLQEDEDEEAQADSGVQSFEIDPEKVMAVKRVCVEMDYPVLEEYDFRNDSVNPDLKIDLKPTTMIRSYQEKSLSKMFGNGRARSGIIVLPCGAGKTLVGITACCTIKKSCLVLCTSGVSVEQWKHQFKIWSNIDDKLIARFTSDTKEKINEVAAVTITTYTMVAFGGQRSAESLKVMNQIREREWGLLLLDEVHVVPAHMFRKVLDKTKAHTKLGLTATLVREDDKIEDLNFLIGPKLYEANWLDLQKSGHIANVQCAEVWCPMTPEFYREYLLTQSESRKRHLYVMNPNKLHACQYLIQYHEARGDRIIVFSDDVYALLTYARKLGKLFIYGPTAGHERLNVLYNFQHNPTHRTIFISKVGDTSIDLPEATVIIQISSHYGSRRQEAQRLGRILRPKPRSDEEHNAFFYSLVSQDTTEMYYSTKRQQFLIDQGYAFKVITSLPGMEKMKKLLSSKKDEIALLADVLTHDGDDVERLEEDFDDITLSRPGAKAKRRMNSMAFLSGGADRSYLEVKKKAAASAPADTSIYRQPEIRHPLFRKRAAKN